ncbi:MAG: PQQ-dependent sugar dehydrogenase, partial [Bacteroidota bacterium]
MKNSIIIPCLLLLAVASCTKDKPSFNGAEVVSQKQRFGIDTISTEFINPWGMAFLPDGRILVTERQGSIRIVKDGKLLQETVEGVPAVYAEGQGGLLDIK